MDRLTDKDTNRVCYDTWELCGLDHECKRDCWKPTPCKIPKIVRKLAEYEDTALAPSEILALKQENERLKDTNKALENDNYNLDMNLTHLSEELDALKANKNEPLTIKEMETMVGEWVWIDCDGYNGYGKIIQGCPYLSIKIIEENPGYITVSEFRDRYARAYTRKMEGGEG